MGSTGQQQLPHRQVERGGPRAGRRALEVVIVALDDQRYAFRLDDVVEVQRMVAAAALPDAPGIVEGVIDVRGRIVPVLDVRTRFGHQRRPVSADDHLLVARAGSREVAVRVDRAIGIAAVGREDIDTSVADVPGVGHVAGIARTDDGLVVIHDLATFLSWDEGEQLDAAIRSHGGDR